MTVSPDDFETHARRTKNQFSDEISRRCCVSRIYYHVFHRLRVENDSHPDSHFTYRSGDHKEASDFLERIGNNALADDFDDLRSKRNKADYDINKTIGEFEFQMFLADFEDFISDAEDDGILS
jgi:uncharacterized protein (UPF0332 family)